jgi:hypothetical protein
MAEQEFKLVDLEDVQDGLDAFKAWGHCVLKVQQGEQIIGIRVKICSVDQEVFKEAIDKAPKPPIKLVTLDPATDLGKQFGVTTKQRAEIHDYTNEEYQRKQTEHNRLFTRKIVGLGIHADQKLKLKDGSIAQTPEDRALALEEKGFGVAHFGEIQQAIQNLTTFSEDERANFLR